MEPATVYYDGSCGLCTRTVRAGVAHSRPGMLHFVDALSDAGARELARRGLSAVAATSLIVAIQDTVHTESRAVIEVTRRLRWPRRLGAALWLVPRPLRDALYRFVSRNRHCLLPRP